MLPFFQRHETLTSPAGLRLGEELGKRGLGMLAFQPERSGRWELAGWTSALGLTAWEAVVATLALIGSVVGIAVDGPWRWMALPGLAFLAFVALRHARRAEHLLARAREINQGLLDLPAQANWVADPTGKLIKLSERWTEWTGVEFVDRSSWVGTIHHDDRDEVLSAWSKAVANGTAHDFDHRVRMRDGSYRWMRARAFPQRDSDGRIVQWVGQVEDIHDRRMAEEQLRQSATLLGMIGTSTDSLIWAKDCDGRMLYVNRAIERLAGITLADVLGRTDAEWNPHKEQAEAFTQADRRVLESGVLDVTEESFTGATGELRYYRAIRSPLRDGKGKIIGTVGVSTDITEQYEAEQRERLLTRELDHRAKNLLAVVQSVVTLTRAGTAPEFKQVVEGRIQALGRAHSMLAASRWEGADLHRIVSEELAPYASGNPDRVVIEGPSMLLRPATAQSLALVVHELATNAVKYGALSADSGQLRVSWRVVSGAEGATSLQLSWTEKGGPPVAPRTDRSRSGFGSRLLRGSIERQLGGSLHLDWAPEGLAAKLDLPLERTAARPPSPSGDGGPALTRPPRRHGPRRAA